MYIHTLTHIYTDIYSYSYKHLFMYLYEYLYYAQLVVCGHTVRRAVTTCLSLFQRDFIVQSGDPSGTGRGGESVFRSAQASSSRASLGGTEDSISLVSCLAYCTGTRLASLTQKRCPALSTGRRGRCPW